MISTPGWWCSRSPRSRPCAPAYVRGRHPQRFSRLPPARRLIGVDAEGCFGDEFMGQERICRVNAAQTGVPEQSLQAGLLENPKAACHFQGDIDHAPGALDHVVLGGDDLGAPSVTMVDAV